MPSSSERGSTSATILDDAPPSPPKFSPTGSAFWMSILAIVVCMFLSAMDLTGVSVVLPTITEELNGGDNFVWVGSAYALASTAILPLIGGLADIFGRKPVMMLCIFFFALGSALAGAAQTMNMLIGARVVQGLGGGGIMTISNIIISDLVPLSQRGLYQGVIGLTFSLASGIGPPVGGALAEKASWRWLFYINLPLTGIAITLVAFFLRVRVPSGSIREKLARIDWLGNLIIIAGTTLAIVGLTWGGVRYPWSSAHVLAPLIIGIILILAFVAYEATVPQTPTIPFKVLTNRTTIGGYLSTLVHGVTSISIIYYLPVFFQSSMEATPLRSSVQMLPTALILSPFALIGGILVRVLNKYRPSMFIGWILSIIGFGILTLLKADSSTSQWVGYQVLVSIGTGIIFSVPVFPVLAPLPVTLTAPGLAFFSFTRSFAQTWGITISSTILQNQLNKKLPPDFVSRFPAGVEIAYAAIPQIKALPEPLRTEVRVAFAESMSTVWKVMAGISGLGVLSLVLLREVEMKAHTDDSYGLEDEKQKQGDLEIVEVRPDEY